MSTDSIPAATSTAAATAAALHPIEQAILKALASSEDNNNNSQGILIDSLVTSTGLSIDQIRRGVEWLKFKDLVRINESLTEKIYLASEGATAVAKGLPERRLLNAVKEGKNTIGEILASGSIRNEEVNAAIAGARRNQWIQLVEGKMTPAAGIDYDKQSPEEIFLASLKAGTDIARLGEDQRKTFEQLKKRPNYIEIKQ
jgi:phenylalanyl-tRNA synthetase alpha chain